MKLLPESWTGETGIRGGELAALTHDDIMDGWIRICKTETHYNGMYLVKDSAKTPAGTRTVVVPTAYKWLLQELIGLNSCSEYIFVNKDGKRLITNCFRGRLRRICRKLGISELSPHKIRKTYITILLDNGADRKLIEKQVGHTDIACSEEHYHRDRRSLKEKINITDSIAELQPTVANPEYAHVHNVA